MWAARGGSTRERGRRVCLRYERASRSQQATPRTWVCASTSAAVYVSSEMWAKRSASRSFSAGRRGAGSGSGESAIETRRQAMPTSWNLRGRGRIAVRGG